MLSLSERIHREGWTEELLKLWAEERAAGVQYVTPYGTVRCPLRWWEYAKAKSRG